MSNLIQPFTVTETYYCKWTAGAREYFETLEEAIEKGNSMYVKPPKMSEENFNYWLKQKSIIGKEVTIEQQLDIVSCPLNLL